MRRLSFISLILLVGAAAAPQRALAQAGTPPPAQTPAQPAAASPTAADDTSRSLFELTDRELFIGGRVTSIDGDPARFQRYQDVRDGLLFSGFRYSFAPPDGTYTFKARANNVGWRDQEYFADYNRAGKLSVTGGYQQIPQFYSVDTMTPYTGSGGTLRPRRRDAARDPERAGQSQRLRPDRAAVRSARAARHRARRRRRHADAEARRHGQLHHAEARRRAAVGRQLRLQQRRRGAAALRLAGQRLHDRHRVDEHEEHAARRLQRIVVRQSRRPARLGQPAAPRRRVGRAGTRPHVAVAVELGADDQLRRLHQAGAQDAGHRLLLLRPVEQRRAAAAVHDQFGAGADCAAARQRRRRSARVLDEPEPDVAPHHRLAVRRALPQLHLRQSHAGDEHHAVRHLRFERRRRRPPAVPISTPTTGPRSTPTRRGTS